ncbi:Hypothetical protein NTJ_12250 [Nesidiocoris tenuis]|uniref:Uncharacterized protein n=1 Tax=Nesidiocoris tenuis TaxID=355587 RepID=A0ABN7B4V5_9HEMI|nr:Hypothetical protein NTJ_12250 [Nesidiocoris tenuis]
MSSQETQGLNFRGIHSKTPSDRRKVQLRGLIVRVVRFEETRKSGPNASSESCEETKEAPKRNYLLPLVLGGAAQRRTERTKGPQMEWTVLPQ